MTVIGTGDEGIRSCSRKQLGQRTAVADIPNSTTHAGTLSLVRPFREERRRWKGTSAAEQPPIGCRHRTGQLG